MSAAEIIAELPRLTAAELALVEAQLRQLSEDRCVIRKELTIRTPRLAYPEQVKDFVKQIVGIADDAGL